MLKIRLSVKPGREFMMNNFELIVLIFQVHTHISQIRICSSLREHCSQKWWKKKKGKKTHVMPVVVTWWSDINFNTKWNMLLNKEHNKFYAPCIFINYFVSTKDVRKCWGPVAVDGLKIWRKILIKFKGYLSFLWKFCCKLNTKHFYWIYS